MELRYVMYGYFITYSISVLVFCISVVTTAGKQINMTYQLAGAETFGDGYSNENGSVVTSNRMGLPDNPLKISTLLKQPPQFLFPLSYTDRRFASQKQELTLPDIISRVTYLNSLLTYSLAYLLTCLLTHLLTYSLTSRRITSSSTDWLHIADWTSM